MSEALLQQRVRNKYAKHKDALPYYCLYIGETNLPIAALQTIKNECAKEGMIVDIAHDKIGPTWIEPLLILYTGGQKCPLSDRDCTIVIS